MIYKDLFMESEYKYMNEICMLEDNFPLHAVKGRTGPYGSEGVPMQWMRIKAWLQLMCCALLPIF